MFFALWEKKVTSSNEEEENPTENNGKNCDRKYWFDTTIIHSNVKNI